MSLSRRSRLRVPLLLLAASSLSPGIFQAASAATPLISRTILFGNPDRVNPQVSPDGTRISYVAPANGVLNVFVAPTGKIGQARRVTNDRNRGVIDYFWSYDSRYLLYLRDRSGEENTHVCRVDLKTGGVKDLTPGKNLQARVQEVSPKFPNEILVALNNRNPQLHDIYRVNLSTGKQTLVYRNDRYLAIVTDDNYRPRLGIAFQPDFTMAVQDISRKTPKTFLTIGAEDVMTTSPIGFDKAGRAVYLLDSRGRDKTALVKMDTISGKTTVLAEGRKADISGAMMHPTRKDPQAVMEEYTRRSWRVLDPTIRRDFAALAKLGAGDISVPSRDLKDRKWIVALDRDNGPVTYYLYDRSTRKARKLFVNRQALVGKTLARTNPVVVKARDGMDIVSYLTLPAGSDPDGNARPNRPLPMVLWVHGGPWARDSWGYNPIHQWLANRGYAVLSVNYRGSTGFGKKFLNAANREWGGKMQHDVDDAVDWAISRKIADPKRVAFTGGSYGGYATLVGMTFTPERYACGVDIFGPSNLVTWMQHIPPYWMPFLPLIRDRVGDVNTEEGRAFLESRSPLTRVGDIRRPLLVAQGANDPRVPPEESDQLVKAMQENRIPVTYVVLPDEGHGLEKPQNRLAFFAVEESFLAKYLGGRYEPIGKALKASRMEVRAGASDVPGLPLALSGR